MEGTDWSGDEGMGWDWQDRPGMQCRGLQVFGLDGTGAAGADFLT